MRRVNSECQSKNHAIYWPHIYWRMKILRFRNPSQSKVESNVTYTSRSIRKWSHIWLFYKGQSTDEVVNIFFEISPANSAFNVSNAVCFFSGPFVRTREHHILFEASISDTILNFQVYITLTFRKYYAECAFVCLFI